MRPKPGGRLLGCRTTFPKARMRRTIATSLSASSHAAGIISFVTSGTDATNTTWPRGSRWRGAATAAHEAERRRRFRRLLI